MVERGTSAKSSCSAGPSSSISKTSICGDVASILAGCFSGDVFDTVAADIERNEELGETLTGGREGGLMDPPHIAAAALTFEGVDVSIATGEVDAEGEIEVDGLEGEAESGFGESDRSSNSPSTMDLESSSSPNSSSSSSFIIGLVGVIV
jgi:hypothetical protein